MKAKGILFKAEMIRALLNTYTDVWPTEPINDNKPWKWQTRRSVKLNASGRVEKDGKQWHVDDQNATLASPHPAGTILYAKETFGYTDGKSERWPKGTIMFRADHGETHGGIEYDCAKWKPSIFMPKVAARLWFKVVSVRVERVNEITEADAKAEGVHYRGGFCCRELYKTLWDSINGKGDFDKGEWVWVYELKRISKPEGIK